MKRITSIREMPEDKRRIDHYVRYCATDGALAEAHLHHPTEPERPFCVMCPSGLNAAGRAIMSKALTTHRSNP